MANIATYLQKILEAVYGEEVRGSIHDALEAMNVESNSAMTYAKDAKDSAFNSAAAAKKSENIAGQKATDASEAAAAAQRSEANAKASETIIEQKTEEVATATSEAKDAQQKAASSEAVATQKAANASSSADAAALSESNVTAAEERVRTLKSEAEKTAAQIASDKETVEAAKQDAANSQAEAKKSADAATQAQGITESAKDTAVAAQESASADASAAQTAREGAETALSSATEVADSASKSAASASESADTAKKYSGNPPKIDLDTKTWWIWNAESGEYEDTHLSSEIEGPQGTSITNITLKDGNHAPGTTDIYSIEMDNGTTYEFTVYNGHNGEGAGDVLGIAFDLTIPQQSWKDGQATVEDEKLLALATHKYFIDSDESCREEYEGCGVRAKDITQTGRITFINTTDPETDLVVNVLRLELSAVS